MKKIIKLIIPVLLLALFFSCGTDDVLDPGGETNALVVTAITASPSYLEVLLNGNSSIATVFTPSTLSEGVTWSCSDTNIVELILADQPGVVFKGVAIGSAILTVTLDADTSISSSALVEVVSNLSIVNYDNDLSNAMNALEIGYDVGNSATNVTDDLVLSPFDFSNVVSI